MPSFKDKNNREWLISLDAPKIREIRNVLKIDLVANDGRAFDQLSRDPVLLVDCLYLLVRKQAKEADVGDETFAEALGGDSLEEAAKALTEAVFDFFPQAQRSVLRSLDEKETNLRKKAVELALLKIDDPTIEEEYLKQVDRLLTEAVTKLKNPSTGVNSPTSSPASAALVPTD